MLSLFASNVHCAGLEPVYSVYDIPSSAYDTEVSGVTFNLGTSVHLDFFHLLLID